MNKEMLVKCEGRIVRFRPIARRFSGQKELQPIDDDWRITRVNPARKAVEVQNLRCDHCLTLGYNHIYSYTSDPMRDVDGRKHGLLQLTVQVSLAGRSVKIEPLTPAYRRGLDRQ